MNILLTGGNGFLGNYLSKNIKKIKIFNFDRTNPLKTPWYDIEGVIHCAGLAHNSHKECLKESYFNANVKLTKELFSDFLKSDANFFIFISTSTIYDGISGDIELDEEIIGNQLSIYAESKLQAERELLKVKGEKKVFILRPSIIVGPNPKGNLRLLQKLVHTRFPIPIPYNSSPNNLTDIRNLTKVIEFIGTNHSVLESGIYNVNDNFKPNIEEILKSISKMERIEVKLIKLPNFIFQFGLKIISFVKPEISKKLNSLFFDTVKISNRKISKIVDLDYNSFQ